jgi:hypothetical protein
LLLFADNKQPVDDEQSAAVGGGGAKYNQIFLRDRLDGCCVRVVCEEAHTNNNKSCGVREGLDLWCETKQNVIASVEDLLIVTLQAAMMLMKFVGGADAERRCNRCYGAAAIHSNRRLSPTTFETDAQREEEAVQSKMNTSKRSLDSWSFVCWEYYRMC